MPPLEQVLGQYPKQVKLVFKHFPLPSHRFARAAAVASMAAGEQGKFWPFHDRLFQSQAELSDAKIDQIAKDLGLDLERYEKAKNSPAIQQLIQRDMAEAQRIGLRGTPTLYVNGRLVRDRSPQGISALVQEELAKLPAK